MSRSPLWHTSFLAARLSLVGLLLMVGCSRPLDRPLEGAQPGRPNESAATRLGESPPTLVIPQPTLVSPVPIVIPIASPSPSPALAGRNPILSGLIPAPEALVPVGPVDIGARIAGSSDLVEVGMTVNGAAVQPQVTQQSSRTWLVAYTSRLDAGKHEVRLNAKDSDGRAGGFRWQFDVQARAAASPVPQSSPTRRP